MSKYLQMQNAAIAENEKRRRISRIPGLSIRELHNLNAQRLLVVGGCSSDSIVSVLKKKAQRIIKKNGTSASSSDLRRKIVLSEINYALEESMPVIALHNSSDFCEALKSKYGSRVILADSKNGSFDPFEGMSPQHLKDICGEVGRRQCGFTEDSDTYINVMEDIIELHGETLSLKSIFHYPLVGLGDSVDSTLREGLITEEEKESLYKVLDSVQGSERAVSSFFLRVGEFFKGGASYETDSIGFDEVFNEKKILCMKCFSDNLAVTIATDIVLSAIKERLDLGEEALIVFESVNIKNNPSVLSFISNQDYNYRWIISTKSLKDAVNSDDEVFGCIVSRSDADILLSMGVNKTSDIRSWSKQTPEYVKLVVDAKHGKQTDEYAVLSSGNQHKDESTIHETRNALEESDISSLGSNQAYILTEMCGDIAFIERLIE